MHSKTYPFTKFAEIPYSKLILNNSVIAIGENPHRVQEYYTVLEDIILLNLDQKKKTLLLLEQPYCLDHLFQDFLKGNFDQLKKYTIDHPVFHFFYGARQVEFFNFLSTHANDQFTCKFINTSAHYNQNDLINLAKNYNLAKWKQNLEAMENINIDANLRESFIFSEAQQAIEEFKPEKIILSLGSMHIRKLGGKPTNEVFVPSLFNRLISHYHYDGVSISLLSLDGKYGSLKRENGSIVCVADPIPTLDEDMTNFKSCLKNSHQGFKFLLTEFHDTIGTPNFNPDFKEWVSSYDYIISCLTATADLPTE